MSNVLEPKGKGNSEVLHTCTKPNIDEVANGSFWNCTTCRRWWKADRRYPDVRRFYGNKWTLVTLTNIKDRLRIRKLLQDQEKND